MESLARKSWYSDVFSRAFAKATKAEGPRGRNGGKFPRTELSGEWQLSTKRAGIHRRCSRMAMEKYRDLSAQRKIT